MAANILLLFSEAHCCTTMTNAKNIYTAFGKWDKTRPDPIQAENRIIQCC